MIRAADLLVGSDEEVVENLYLGVLGRWPDAGGRLHFLRRIADGGATARWAALREMVESEEGRIRAAPLDLDAPTTEGAARATAALLRARALRAEVAALREQAPPALGAEALAEIAALRAEFAALRDEVRERLAALEAAPPHHSNS